MKVFLIDKRDDGRLTCTMPYEGADHVVVDVWAACPYCAAEGPVKIGGAGQRASADDRAWEADAGALCCRAFLGILRVEVSTLFGVREDRAVLAGRCRVY